MKKFEAFVNTGLWSRLKIVIQPNFSAIKNQDQIVQLKVEISEISNFLLIFIQDGALKL